MQRRERWASWSGAERVQGARESLARGIDFLLARQAKSGVFTDFATLAGESDEWTTAYVAEGLREGAAAGGHRGADVDEALERAATLLATRWRVGAGWGYNQRVPADADSTAWALIFLRTRPAAVEISAATAALRGHQMPGGGVATYRNATSLQTAMELPPSTDVSGWCAPHASVTASAGRALWGRPGAEAASATDAAWRYLEAQADPAGFWPSYWWTEPFYATAEAVTLALALGRRTSECATLRRGLDWLSSRQDGAWGLLAEGGQPATVFSSAAAFRALARGPLDATRRSDALAFLTRMQQRDGGWPSEPILRIPSPGAARADAAAPWRVGGLGALALVADHRRTFTTATCVAALGLLLHAAQP